VLYLDLKKGRVIAVRGFFKGKKRALTTTTRKGVIGIFGKRKAMKEPFERKSLRALTRLNAYEF